MDDLDKIQAEIAKLQKQAENMIASRKASLIEEMKANIKTYGITLKDLGLTDKSPAKSGFVVPIKYRFKDQTWTGRGRQPKWVDDFLAAGGKLEDVLVK
jgi:DNA-binding protein H-NS